MRLQFPVRRPLLALWIVFAAGAGLASAQTTQGRFHEAYYLENSKQDYAAAAEIYAAIARDDQASAELRADARKRLAICREETAIADPARLMPPTPLVYVEINRPGEQINRLLDQVGLLATAENALAEGGPRVAISPELLPELLGIRSIAAAITGFDPSRQRPSGVAIIHPGNLEVLRAAIQTALPIQCDPVDPIGGFATYDVEGEVFVTLTSRLVIVATHRDEIRGVVERISHRDEPSLATNESLADLLKDRDDALLFFCVNAKPIMPMVQGMMAVGGAQSPEFAVAQAVLDPASLETVVGRAGVTPDGVRVDLELRLAEGHRNLAFNFARMPAVDERCLKRIPSGAAGFATFALNEVGSRYSSKATAANEPQVISALDLGREIFANVVGVAVFVAPSEGVPQRVDEQPIPDLGAIVTVHDPAKSEALWSQILGLASLATGSGLIEGDATQIAGTRVRSFRMPEGLTIYLAVTDGELLISPSKSIVARSLETRRSGQSVLSDPAFARSISRVGPDTTLAVFGHVGRLMDIAASISDDRDIEELTEYRPLFNELVGSLVVTHSANALRASIMATGLPKLGELAAAHLRQHHDHRAVQRTLAAARRDGDWAAAQRAAETALARAPHDPELLWQQFQIAAAGKGDRDAALAAADALFAALADDAGAFNRYAWVMLQDESICQQYADVALRFSRRSNELTGHSNWMYVDTLAWAKFRTGDVRDAVELERKALDLAAGDPRRGEAVSALATFEAALAERSPE